MKNHGGVAPIPGFTGVEAADIDAAVKRARGWLMIVDGAIAVAPVIETSV